VAWILTRRHSSLFLFLQRRIPRFNPTDTRTTSLWVSGAMGENVHEIGHISGKSAGRKFNPISYVRWLPDEKTLSFISNDTLYTVPVN